MTENDYFQVHEYRYQFLEQAIAKLRLPKGTQVLDVGCYPPFLFHFLQKQGFDVSGIASNHEQIHDKQVKVLNIETDEFPWKSNTFDLIVFTEVLEHLPHSPVTPLKEM